MTAVSYEVEGDSPLEHLAIENLLLETWDEKYPLLLFYRNFPSVIIGRNQNPWREVSPASHLPLFRRLSGGGAVYHDDGNLNWAFIVPRDIHSQESELAVVASAVSDCGIAVRPGPRGGIYCDAATGHGGEKVSGTARRFTPKNVLHHGTLLVSSNLEALRESLGGIATSEDKSIPSTPATPVNLCDIKPNLTAERLIGELAFSTGGSYPRRFPRAMVDAARLGEEIRFLSSREWIFGATPAFSVSVYGKSVAVTVRINDGLVAGIAVSGAPGDPYLGPRIENELSGFLGKPFSHSLPGEMANSLA